MRFGDQFTFSCNGEYAPPMVDDSISRFHKKLEPADRDTCEILRDMIDQELPDAESKIWHAHPVWFLDGNPVVGYSKLKDCVRLLFWGGQSFEAGGVKPEGKFKAAEVRYTDHNQIDASLLAQWLHEARHVQWDYRNLVKRRGRLERIK